MTKTKTWTSCKSCGKSKWQTFQEQVKHDPKYSITESKCYISMGSLKQVDPHVTAAPKAVLLQDILLVHLLTSLHPCLWALGKGGNCFTDMSFLGMGKEVDVGLGPWAGGLQHCTATPCSNSSHIRCARVMDPGEQCQDCQEPQGPIRSC